MDDQRTSREGSGSLTPRTILAIAIAYLGVTYISRFVAMAIGLVIGPFASLAVGAILLFVASKIYRSSGLAK